MRGKDYNTGLRGVLFESRHYERMGSAVWLYGWLVLRQTHQQGSVGWVLGGAPISYREIEEETGFNPRTLERWMQTLRRCGYVETEAAPAGVIIRITKAKKFPQAPRNSAKGLRKDADPRPQSCGASGYHSPSNERVPSWIASSSVGGIEEGKGLVVPKQDFHSSQAICGNPNSRHPANEPTMSQSREIHKPPANADVPAEQGSLPLNMRLLRQLLRAEREEAVRRELAVGTGPEVRRP